MLFVGSLVRRKGIDVLLRSWAAVRVGRPDAHLLLVGRDRFDESEATDFLESELARLAPADAATVHRLGVRDDGSDGALTLAATRGDFATNRLPNLIRDEELWTLGGQATGFYGTEWAGARPFRWTRGAARLLVPMGPEPPPSALAVEVLLTGRPKQLSVAVDGCVLFDQAIHRRWSATFDLGDCPLVPPELEITLLSDTHVPATRDNRALGVAVGLIELHPGVTSL